MSVIDLAHAIDETRKALASAKALYEAELKKVEDLKAKHASELKSMHDAVGAAENVVSSHMSKLHEMSNKMLGELGHNVSDDLKSAILAAQKNRRS